MNPLNQVDLCFVIDTTGSMGSFIQAAQRQLLDTLNLLSSNNKLDLEVGLVEYRDHPPQDESFITRIYPLTANTAQMQKAINGLKADGGGDGPEAVYRGVFDACTRMVWRPNSCRFALLVGDAPPHGFAQWRQQMDPGSRRDPMSDHWPEGCPSGLTVQSVTAAAETAGVTVHALCMQHYELTIASFSAIAKGTGGTCMLATNANEVIGQIQNQLAQEFKDLQLDQQVLQTIQKLQSLEVAPVAERLNQPRLQVASAIARLGKRGFLDTLVIS